MPRAKLGRWCLLLGLGLVGLTALVAMSSRPAASGGPAGLPPQEVVFTSEDRAILRPGCDAVSAFDPATGAIVARGETMLSPGRLTGTSDLRVALATQTNWRRFIYVLGRTSPESRNWSTGSLVGTGVATFGGIAVLPDDETYLVATESSGINEEARDETLPNVPPYYVRKYRLPSSYAGERKVGRELGRIRLDGIAVEIIPAGPSSLVHILTHNAKVHTVDADTMKEVAPAIQLQPVVAPPNPTHAGSANVMHASLTADGRYMVSNRWGSPEINVADLSTRSAWTLSTGGEVETTGGLAVNRGWVNEGLLALHAMDRVVVYQFDPRGPLTALGQHEVRPPNLAHAGMATEHGPHLAISWSASGSHIVAAVSEGSADFSVFEVTSGGNEIGDPVLVATCRDGRNMPNDIWTANGLLDPPPTPTSSATGTTRITSTPIPPVPTQTPTGAPTRTITPEPTVPPTRDAAYLPLVLSEECVRSRMHSDVVLVIDASSSMLDSTAGGRTKLSIAVEAVEQFLGELDLPLDQAAIVQFNDSAGLLSELTGDRSALLDALDQIVVRRQTRIDLGVRFAREELESARRHPGNRAAMIVLTDSRANPIGPDAAIREAGLAKAEGVTIFTIGLGADLDLDALEAIASKPSYFYRAPDAEDLAAIYAEIAVEIPCPAEGFWGRR